MILASYSKRLTHFSEMDISFFSHYLQIRSHAFQPDGSKESVESIKLKETTDYEES